VPTPEGPRPLLGHGFALLGGGWRQFVQSIEQERRQAIWRAARSNLPLLWDGGMGTALAELAGERFTTEAGATTEDDLFEVRRTFRHATENPVLLARLRDRTSIFDPDAIDRFPGILNSSVVVLSGYTSTLRQLHSVAPDALRPIGRFSALIDLEKLPLLLRARCEMLTAPTNRFQPSASSKSIPGTWQN
jgi:hypothetical protein